MQTLASALDHAYDWLCHQRKVYPPDADVWDLRLHWHAERIRLEAELRTGRFRFGPLQVITKADGEVLHLWSARDALVLKALALVLGPVLRLSPRCVHVKGHGGLKAAVRDVQRRLPEYRHHLRVIWCQRCQASPSGKNTMPSCPLRLPVAPAKGLLLRFHHELILFLSFFPAKHGAVLKR